MKRLDRVRLVTALLLLGILVAPAAAWQQSEPSEDKPEELITVEALETRLEEIDRLPDGDAKTQLRELYAQAVEQVKLAETQAGKIAEFERLIGEAPERLATIRADLEQPDESPPPVAPSGASLTELEQRLQEVEANLAKAEKAVEDLEAEQAQRKELRKAAPDKVAANDTRLDKVTSDLATLETQQEDPQLVEARRTLLQTERRALTLETEKVSREIQSFDARTDLLSARLDQARRKASAVAKEVDAWQEIVNARRKEEAERAREEAERQRREAARRSPEFQSLAEENERLADRRVGPDGLTSEMEDVQKDLDSRKDEVDRLRSGFARVRAKIRAAGLTQAMGVLLRRQSESLPDADLLRRSHANRRDRISNVQLEAMELEEKRDKLFDISAAAEAYVEEGIARELLTAQRDLLDTLQKDYARFETLLVELDRVTQTLIDATEEYRYYVRERILWVRSIEGNLIRESRATVEALGWLLDPESWRVSIGRSVEYSRKHSLRWLSLLVILGLLIVLRRVWRAILRSAVSRVSDPRTDSIWVTMRSLFATLMLAAPIPLLLWMIGTWLVDPHERPNPAESTGFMLQRVAVFLLLLEFLRQIARPGGLGETQFQWRRQALDALRRKLLWFAPTFIVFAVPVLLLNHPSIDSRWSDALGRPAFCAAMIAISLFLFSVLAPRGAVLGEFLEREKNGFIAKSRYLWYGTCVGFPLLMCGLALTGYDYTALELTRSFSRSLQFVLLLVIFHAFLMRWLFVARRRLAVKQERLRSESAAAEAEARGRSPETPAAAADALDVPEIRAQTRKLAQAVVVLLALFGFFTIWEGVLPAIRVLETVQIWPEVKVVKMFEGGRFPVLEQETVAATEPTPDAEASAADTTEAKESTPGFRPPLPIDTPRSAESKPEAASSNRVTLLDVAYAILLLVLTVVATRNLPGLLEMILLRRLPLDQGARYAISLMGRYAIMVIGVTAAFGMIGIGWSKMQWLVAALTFGLAFGLQEIFANFVSGIVMLLERPVRMGDIVTVGNVDGKVSRIQIRATTITDWDRREMIVPNKEFITGRIVNWTLSNAMTRVTVPVRVPYTSNPTEARDLLLKVARDSNLVMPDPEPAVVYRSFDENGLMLHLWVYIAERAVWRELMNELHGRIFEEFRAAGIEIAPPQLDLRLTRRQGVREIGPVQEDQNS